MAQPVQWLGPGIIKVKPPTPPSSGGGYDTASPDTPVLNPDGTTTVPSGTGNVPPVYPGGGPQTGQPPGGLGDVPEEGDASTTDGMSLGDVLTWSTGNPLLDAGAGALAGYASAPVASQRAYYAAAGAAASGLLGVLGLAGVVGAALLLRRGGAR